MDAKTLKKGFNSGYTLKTHMPGLADKFSKELIGRDDPYAVGFIAGVKEREKEVFIKRGKDIVKSKPRISSKHPLRSKEKDQDKDSPDRS